MPGIILLDDDQQLLLTQSQTRASRPSASMSMSQLATTQRRGGQQHSTAQSYVRATRPTLPLSMSQLATTQRRPNRLSIEATRDPPCDVMLNSGSPRTDFTMSRHSPRSNFTSSRVSPRTDFTSSRLSPRTNFTSSRISPRTDFTSSRIIGPRTNFTSGSQPRGLGETHATESTMAMSMDYNLQTMVTADVRPDSYPILRDDRSVRTSSGSTDDDSAVQYAGTSSGLKISVRWIMVGLIAGILAGVFLSEAKIGPVATQWISMPGELFLRALKCLVVPYVFCSVAVAVGDIVFVGKVSIVGLQTVKIYVTFWLATVTMGVTVALLFRPFFRSLAPQGHTSVSKIGFACSNGNLLTSMSNGSVACTSNATVLTDVTTFEVYDINNVFIEASSEHVAKLTLSDQIMQTVLPIVSSNIFASLASNELLSLITFSTLLGTIAGRSYFTKTRRVNYLYLTLLQLRNALFLMMEWTIWLSPMAVVFVVAGSFASNPGVLVMFRHAYPYLIAALTGALLQALVVYPLIVFLTTRCNPYTFMKQMARAYMFAFASASSLATMPVTLSCVKNARMCSLSIANFVISIGVVSSTSGMGFYMPIALVFIAESSGNGDQITILRVIGMFVLSLLTCPGTSPIPASGVVAIATAYSTLFGDVPTTALGYVAAMDFFFDRIVTSCNVNDDLMALKIISESTDETVAQDQLGQRI